MPNYGDVSAVLLSDGELVAEECFVGAVIDALCSANFGLKAQDCSLNK